MFETTEESGFGAATYLYRGANLDSSIKSCEDLCKFINQVQGDGTEIKNLYVGCTEKENGNDQDLTNWWRSGTNFKCNKADGTDCMLTLRYTTHTRYTLCIVIIVAGTIHEFEHLCRSIFAVQCIAKLLQFVSFLEFARH